MSVTGMATPEMADQRMSALARANEIRSFRAQLKADLKAGRRSVADVLADPPAEIESMRVVELLTAVPKIGVSRARAALKRLDLSASVTVAALGDRRRGALVEALAAGLLPRSGRVSRPSRPRRVVPRPVPVVERRPVPPTNCRVCRVRLIEPTGLCGFCAEERAA